MKFKVDSGALKLLYFIAAGFVVFGVLMIYEIAAGVDHAAKWFLLVWVVGVSFAAYSVIKQPTAVKLNDAELSLVFSNKFKSMSFDVASLEKIEVDNGGLTFLFNTKIKIEMSNRITGLHVLITELKKYNSDIEIKGC